jgi:hypothetical protein
MAVFPGVSVLASLLPAAAPGAADSRALRLIAAASAFRREARRRSSVPSASSCYLLTSLNRKRPADYVISAATAWNPVRSHGDFVHRRYRNDRW